MHPIPITAGTQVEHQGIAYTVRAVDGNVLALEASDGSFSHFAHVSSVIDCPPPATPTAPASLPAPADAGQRVGTPAAFLAWECADGGPDPLPRWKRYCGSRAEVLIGASFALLSDPWGNVE